MRGTNKTVEGVDVDDSKVVGIRVRSQNTGEKYFAFSIKCKQCFSTQTSVTRSNTS